MRFFPRTARQRLLAAGAAGALAISAVSVPWANADDLRDRQKRVEQKVDRADEALEGSSSRLRRAVSRVEDARARLDEARAELDRVRVKLDEARERDQEMQELLAEARARLAQAEEDLAQGREDVDAQREAVTDLVTKLYQEGDPQLQAFSSLLTTSDASDLTWTQEGQSVMLGQESRAYDELQAAEVLLEVREQQVAEAEQEVEAKRQEAAEHLVVMKDLTQQAKDARARVGEVVLERKAAKRGAVRARQKDRAELRELREQERSIREKIRELMARQAARKAARGGYNGRTGGFLSSPVPGIVTSSYGYRTHPIYGYYSLHNGTDFRAYCGTALRAPAGGTVLSKYYSSVYGNRLYVNVGTVNGKNVTVVYNHASGYSVGVGQRVSRGQVVGYSGSTGWSTACHLHFMVLVNGQPVNPMNWM